MGKKLTLAAALALAMTVTAEADSATVRLGTLVCDISGGVGLILGSHKSLQCNFQSISGETADFDGSITKVGVDIGVTEASRMVWAVLAPASTMRADALEGRYFGATAEATPGVGVGANVLIGGFDRAINLQPLSLQAQAGLNVAAGVAEMTLRAVPAPVFKN
ncbi:MAG: DUF992 domain-containing protein [Pseudomonadota bacterium]